MACLDTIIGLSRTDCQCFEDTPEDYNVSDSGLYIDETEGMNLSMAEASADCEQGDIWDILTKARETAILEFKRDFLLQLSTKYKKTLPTASYTIGSKKTNNGKYNPGTTYAGIRLAPRSIKNGVMKLQTVKFLSDTTETINFFVYNNLSSTALQTFSISAVAGVDSSSATLNYSLPMYVSGEAVEYYLVYEVGAGLPYQNKIACSPCLHWELNSCNPPCYGNRKVKDQMWHNDLMIGGIKGNSWDELDGQTGSGNQNNGIIINISMNCDYEEIICQNLDYGAGDLPTANGMGIASAIQWKAALYVINTLLTSPKVSRLNMINRDETGYLKQRLVKKYDEMVLWLAQTIDINENGCYYCESRMVKGGILA